MTDHNTVKSSGLDFNHWETVFADYIESMEHVDSGHDINHIKRVVKTAKQFASEESACNLAVVIPAAWLHDCVAVAKNSPLRKQASAMAANKAVTLLAKWNYPETYYNAIKHAIEAHSFSANIRAESLEAQVVQDADRMDGIGAIGVARTLLVGEKLGSSLYNPDDPFCQQRQTDDKNYMIDHFYAKLLQLKDSFYTDSAKKEAMIRHEFMLSFLSQLKGEIG
ncbi:MAG: HD domain-containing protein [Proteobacteria bacterium]|nr:HD domain-containing protein [Pseudomonadota bacterium]